MLKCVKVERRCSISVGGTPTSGFEKKWVDFDLNSAFNAARKNGVIGVRNIVGNKSRMTSSKVRSICC